MPTLAFELLTLAGVARLGRGQLVGPPRSIRLGARRMLWAGVPEVAHDEDGEPCAREDEVRPRADDPLVHPEPQAARMECAAQRQFRAGVARPLPDHLASYDLAAGNRRLPHMHSVADVADGGTAVKRGRREEVIPSAARLLGSLRDLGYEFTNAVADLVDNSVSAGASQVDITVHFDGPDSWVRVADDGRGMSATAISEAMRLGSGGKDYLPDDLGKFGLGLKTASLSQARSVTVASRSNAGRRVIDCRQLDLDEVLDTDRWEIVHPAAGDRPSEVVEPLRDGTGTVVLWHKLDRVLSRRDPFGGWAERHLLLLADRLDLHLGMVFGRFLAGQTRARRKRLVITINGSKVEPWDPFCRDERTDVLPELQIPVAGSMVLYRPYVLPPQRDFSDDDAWRRASGPNQWNRQQGLYIYRADRLIQSGGWSWLRGQDEHTKLARASLDFMPDLDEAFEINISKMRVKLPEDLRDQLRPLVTFLTRYAEDRYRKSSRFTSPPRPPTSAGSSGRGMTVSAGGVSGAGGTAVVHSADSGTDATGGAGGGAAAANAHIGHALEAAAERAGVQKPLIRLRRELDPEVARDLGW